MNIFALNIVLAFAWAALTATFTLPSLIAGFAVGFGALWLAQPLFAERSPYFRRFFKAVKLAALFLYELVVSSVQVVWDVLTPEHKSSPELLELPLEVETDGGILLLTNLISLTPGTLSLDISPDRRRLIVHAMFAEDPGQVIAGLKRFERWVKEAVE